MSKVNGEKNVHEGHRARMREKLRNSGADTFCDHELLELLLFFSIPRCNTNEISHRLLERFGSIRGIFEALPGELELVEGIGENSATLITLISELFRRVDLVEPRKRYRLDNLADFISIIRRTHFNQRQERVCMALFGADGALISCELLSSGDAVSVGINISDAVRRAILSQASFVIMFHNHPGGELEQSDEDENTTQRLMNALSAVDIMLYEHIIFSDTGYYCMLSRERVVNAE